MTKEAVMPIDDELRAPKKRGLGRGLNALFEDEEATGFATPAPAANEEIASGPRKTLGVDQLQPGGYQPRQIMDEAGLAELAESIAVHGIIQPLIVRPLSGGRYEIIAGERRWRAAQLAQLHEVPVVIRELSNEQALEIGLIENLQREDLSAIEEAYGYQRLMDEFKHTQDKLALAVGKSRSHVANMLRLLTLPSSVHEMMTQGRISAGHARAIVTAEDPEALAREIVERGLSVRETERRVSEDKGKTKPGAAKKAGIAAKDSDMIALEKDLANNLGMPASVDMKPDGKGGTLKLSFKDLDGLDLLLKRLMRI